MPIISQLCYQALELRLHEASQKAAGLIRPHLALPEARAGRAALWCPHTAGCIHSGWGAAISPGHPVVHHVLLCLVVGLGVLWDLQNEGEGSPGACQHTGAAHMGCNDRCLWAKDVRAQNVAQNSVWHPPGWEAKAAFPG